MAQVFLSSSMSSALRSRPAFPAVRFPAFVLLPVIEVVGFDEPDLARDLFVFLEQDHRAYAPWLALVDSAIGQVVPQILHVLECRRHRGVLAAK